MNARLSSEVLVPASAGRARPPSSSPRLQPREAGAILDLAIEGLLARLAPALLVALGLWVPFHQVSQLLGLSGLDGYAADLASVAWNSAALIPTGFAASVVVSLVGDFLIGGRTPLAAGIARGLVRGPGAVLILFLTQIVTLPLMLLCVAPYFLAQWLTWAALPIFVLEGEGLLTAAERARASRSPAAYLLGFPRRLARSLRRSWELSAGSPAFRRWLLLALVGQLVLAGLFDWGAVGLTTPEAREFLRGELHLESAAVDLFIGALAALFSALSSCLRASLMVAYYLDLRARREGWDLELVLERPAEARP
jgi:hypothetical protein